MGDVWIATNVNSLASFHAVMTYGTTGCLFGQLVHTGFHTVRAAQPKTS